MVSDTKSRLFWSEATPYLETNPSYLIYELLIGGGVPLGGSRDGAAFKKRTPLISPGGRVNRAGSGKQTDWSAGYLAPGSGVSQAH